MADIVQQADKTIVLIDEYVDIVTLNILEKKEEFNCCLSEIEFNSIENSRNSIYTCLIS